MNYKYKGVPCTLKARFDYGLVQIKVSGQIVTVHKSELQEATTKVVVMDKEPKTKQTEQPKTLADLAKTNINTATQDELVKLKSIGRVSARKIIDHRPADGYVDMEQLKGLNVELDRVQWDVVETKIVF